jgi:cytidylate kinase
VSLANVLWIGGGQGSGKSSIGKALSRRRGLQLYNIDHRTQAHVPRQAPHEFTSLTLDERWVEPEVDTMLRWFLETSQDRLRIVLEDLAELPAEPGVIVEGPQLFPSFVAPMLASPAHAVFLVPQPEEQRERLLARGPMTWTSQPLLARAKAVERDLRISQVFAREAEELGLPVLTVDAPLDEMIERADALLADVPGGGDLSVARRIENDAIATQVRLYRATGEPSKPYPQLIFFCECGRVGCTDELELTLEEYDAISDAADRSPLRRPTP